MESKQLGLVLILIGLVAVNLVYLADLFAGELVTKMGPLSWTAMVTTNVVVVVGLVVLGRSTGSSTGED
jgi:hypothetical protein